MQQQMHTSSCVPLSCRRMHTIGDGRQCMRDTMCCTTMQRTMHAADEYMRCRCRRRRRCRPRTA
eukprot:15055462-Alexandrium_andersonii.AAC.1